MIFIKTFLHVKTKFFKINFEKNSDKKYIHEVTPDMTQLASIDISFTDLDVDGVKSFLDYGTSLNKLIKKK